MTMTMKICLLPQIFTVSAKQMRDINTSEKASNSNLPLIISMVRGHEAVAYGPQFLLYERKHFTLRVQKIEKKVHSEGRMTSFYLH